MGFKVLPKSALVDWVKFLAVTYRVVAPQPRHGQYVFAEVTDPSQVVLDYPTTILPPKQYLLPPRETLFTYTDNGRQIEANIETIPTVLLGVHTCDMHAIGLLDKVHNHGFADQHYQAHRQNTYLVSIECLKPCMPHSFCKSMGTLTVTEDFDLHMTDLGEVYAMEVGSEKGEALLHDFEQVWDATEEDYQLLSQVLMDKWPQFSYQLEFDVTELPDILNISQKSAYWRELGDRCLGCGMCTKVCPTCYCFDVQDEVDLTLDRGKRIRAWDSCQVEEFALVAGGHNFRAKCALRLRHRFMRKGKYQYEAFGVVGCVGCGRCAQACLVHITPVETFNELYRRSQSLEKAEVKA